MRLIDADEAYKVLTKYYHHRTEEQSEALKEALGRVPTAEPRLSEDDKEVIRIHLGAIKEELCNQRRWDEAQEYEGIIERLNGCPNCGARMEKNDETDRC